MQTLSCSFHLRNLLLASSIPYLSPPPLHLLEIVSERLFFDLSLPPNLVLITPFTAIALIIAIQAMLLARLLSSTVPIVCYTSIFSWIALCYLTFSITRIELILPCIDL